MTNEPSPLSHTTALNVSDVFKAYGSTVALDGTSFSCQVGEIHGLIGENGAGKSTLVKILSGLVRPDRGEISILEKPVSLRSPREALSIGIATAFQEHTLLLHMTVAQNLMLRREPRTRIGVISPARTSVVAAEVLAEWDAGEIDPDKLVSDLSFANRQRLEVIRALSHRPAIALLDEATAALGEADVEWLFRQIGKFKSSGGTVVFISHRMGEIRDLCGRCTVLRDGREVRTFSPQDLSNAQVVELMAGKAIRQVYGVRGSPPERSNPALVADHLSSRPGFEDISFELRRGEILGVAGLQGHGQRELFMALFGARRFKGSLKIDGKPLRMRSPHDAINAHIGISLVPEERKTEGLMVNMSGLANLTIASLKQFTVGGFIRRGRERAEASATLTAVNASVKMLDREVWTLSGGNQQKLAIGKWLLAGTRILLMFDPTRGVDIQTKTEIFGLMHKLVKEGRSILFYSTDVEELVDVTDRTLVIYGGRIIAVLEGPALSEESLVRAMLGHSQEAEL